VRVITPSLVVAICMLFGQAALTQTREPIPARGDQQSARLLALVEAANGRCRGGSGDEDRTWLACSEREVLASRLFGLGWCYGREGEAGFEQKWHRCSVGSRLNENLPLTHLGNTIIFPLGISIAEFKQKFTSIDCSREICGFRSTPQILCPAQSAACEGLEIFFENGKSVGFSVSVNERDWQELLARTSRLWGKPMFDKITLRPPMRFSTEYSTWTRSHGKIAFVKTIGIDLQGRPVHSPYAIMLTPPDATSPR